MGELISVQPDDWMLPGNEKNRPLFQRQGLPFYTD
jgi:hypothetical protein